MTKKELNKNLRMLGKFIYHTKWNDEPRRRLCSHIMDKVFNYGPIKDFPNQNTHGCDIPETQVTHLGNYEIETRDNKRIRKFTHGFNFKFAISFQKWRGRDKEHYLVDYLESNGALEDEAYLLEITKLMIEAI
jgi:hypothetical protein